MECIRVSIGSAAVLGLKPVHMIHPPTTIHLLQYSEDGCRANCGFCPQARKSIVDKKMLSRVSWPAFPWPDVKERLVATYSSGKFRRVCIQTVVYPAFQDDLLTTTTGILSAAKVPLSVALVPVGKKLMIKLHDVGVERVGIALDAVTPSLFSKIKGHEAPGPYSWDGHWRALWDALSVFGRGRVSTHLIIGLGERVEEAISLMQRLHDAGITIGLFAFMPVEGTKLSGYSQPDLLAYRQAQLARHLLVTGIARHDTFAFDGATGLVSSWGMQGGSLIAMIKEHQGVMFKTTGCPSCNRPYYTEHPRGPLYNHPGDLSPGEIDAAIDLLFPRKR